MTNKRDDRPQPSPALTLDEILRHTPSGGTFKCHKCGKSHEMRGFITEFFDTIIRKLGEGRSVYLHAFCRLDPKYIPGRKGQKVGLDTVADGEISYPPSIGIRFRIMPAAKKAINDHVTERVMRYVRAVFGNDRRKSSTEDDGED